MVDIATAFTSTNYIGKVIHISGAEDRSVQAANRNMHV